MYRVARDCIHTWIIHYEWIKLCILYSFSEYHIIAHQTYDICILEFFLRKTPGLRWESNPHLHNSGVMLYHLSC